MLIAARFVQGIGASLLFPVGISVISNAFPVACSRSAASRRS